MNTLTYTPEDIFAEARGEAEVQSLMNTDFYKLLMLDFILDNEEYKNLRVRRSMKIRTPNIKTAEVIPLESLKRQLDYVRSIQGISEEEREYLRGLKNEQGKRLLSERTISHLWNIVLPYYKIGVDENQNYTLSFEGKRSHSLLWEIYGLKIINSLYMYHYTQKANLTEQEFDSIIKQSIKRLYKDIETFKSEPDTKFMEFGTRRSLSTNYQRMVYDILRSEIPDQCIGTSNVMLAKEHGTSNPKGTNAHELRMIPTALHDDPKKIVAEMYDVDRKRAKHYPELALLLPDTYGSTYYFKHCPKDIIDSHKGTRVDSKKPSEALPEYEEFLIKANKDPKQFIPIPSDGETASTAVKTTKSFKDTFGKQLFGIGTNLSNNTKGTRPRETEPFGPFGSFSVVIKPTEVQRPTGERVSTVKLSDNPSKAMGEKTRVDLFKTIFGVAGVQDQEVLV